MKKKRRKRIKDKGNEGVEYSIVHFNSTAKTVINSEFSLNKCFDQKPEI